MSKVLVAMSGGVDSSAAAYLVRSAGNETGGATMKFYETSPAPDSIKSAKQTCEKLGIEHYVFDVAEEFKREVMDEFVSAYLRGDTPNPCVVCNKKMKFGRYMELARETGYDTVATGHYAKTELDTASGRYLLKKGEDELKDQSYFLWTLSQEQLAHTIFPLGDMRKEKIKRLAEEMGFISAHSRESQDICFLPDGDYRAFITEKYGIPSVPGNFVDNEGNILGRHTGAVGYTKGQRRGLGVPAESRLYVIDKDMANNTVRLGREDELYCKRVLLRDVNLIAVNSVCGDMNVEAKLRYSRTTSAARLIMTGEGTAVLELENEQRGPARGQSAVFYDGDVVIGGGVIM